MKNSNVHTGRGFSLIELMVAMTIGLILTLLIGQIFINSRQIFQSTDSLGRLQENARYALALLTREARLASFKFDPRMPRNDIPASAPVANTGVFGALPTLSGTDGGSSGTPASGLPDSFLVRFQGAGDGAGSADGTVQDCLGNRIDAPPAANWQQHMVNTFLILNDPNNNNEPTLFCNTGVPPAACVPGSATCVALVPGVENMQIMYGLDKLGGINCYSYGCPDGSIDTFVDANNVPIVGSWDTVLSVRISLLMRTDDRVASASIPSTTAYSMVGTNVYSPGTDLRLRRIFTTVVDLRNRSQ